MKTINIKAQYIGDKRWEVETKHGEDTFAINIKDLDEGIQMVKRSFVLKDVSGHVNVLGEVPPRKAMIDAKERMGDYGVNVKLEYPVAT